MKSSCFRNAVIGGGCINGIAQLQPIDDSCGAQIQIIFNPFFKNFVRNTACSKGVYIDRKRPGDADGISTGGSPESISGLKSAVASVKI